MPITITCPLCGTEAEIESSLLGKKLRCASPECRKTFRVAPDGHTFPIGGDVSDGPVQADWMAQPPPTSGPAEADWLSAPPPMSGGPASPMGEVVEYAPAMAAPAYTGDAPESAGYYQQEAFEDSGSTYDPYGYHKRSNKGKYIVLGIIFLCLIGTGIGAWYFISRVEGNKAKLEKQAEEFVIGGNFGQGKRAFEELSKQYPDPKDQTRYNFWLKWSDINLEANSGRPEGLKAARASLVDFYSNYKADPVFRERNFKSLIWNLAILIADRSADQATKSEDAELVATTESMLNLAKDTWGSEKDSNEAEKKQKNAEAKLAQAKEVVSSAETRKLLIKQFDQILDRREPQGADIALNLFDEKVKALPLLAKQEQLNRKLEEILTAEPGWITYRSVNQAANSQIQNAQGTSLLLCPPIKPAPTDAVDDGTCVLALAKGTLYGLSTATGEPRWAIRVGLDTQGLPARLPSRKGQPDIALVISVNERKQYMLNAVDVNNGKYLWQRNLSAASVTGAMLIGSRAYLPTMDGRLNVIDLANGRLLGYFELGYPLPYKPLHDAKHNRLYVPAESKRIFVIDLGKNQCVDILYTNHPSRGLRGEPVITDSLIVLAEQAGVGAMKIRAFALQDKGKDIKPKVEKTIPGHAWFKPYFDGDMIGFLSDKGYLMLFGTNRGPTKDDPLMPITDAPLPIGVPPGAEPSTVEPSKATQIAYVNLNDWWMLVNDRLYIQRFDVYRKQMVSVSDATLELGSPIHMASVSQDNRFVILVTQTANRVLATAMHRSSNKVYWQRQLGVTPAQEAVSMGNHVLTIDRSGAVFQVDARKIPANMDMPWLTLGDWPGMSIQGINYARLIPTPSGAAAIGLTHNPETDQLHVRRFEPGKGVTVERIFRLSSPPQGTPAVNDEGAIFIPCRDGNLREFHLNASNHTPVTLTWRDFSVALNTPGHVLFLSNKEIIATDGGRKLLRWERDDRRGWQRVSVADITLPARIVTPLLAMVDANNQPAVVVGDENGRLHMVATGGIPNQREWETRGTITRGPFRLQNSMVGCIVNGRQLVWFEASQPDAPIKAFPPQESSGSGMGIVGIPHVIGSIVLIPELSGRFLWLDLKQNRTFGQAFQLMVSLIPATGAVPLGQTDWAFAPLSDGTVLLLQAPGTSTPKNTKSNSK